MGPHRHAAGNRGRGSNGRSEADLTSRRLGIVLGLVVLYTGVEIVGGLMAGSLALLADAGHMFSDAWALALALFASWLARRPATSRHTYGYYRVETLAAFVNAVALIGVALFVMWEAVDRLRQPREVRGLLMMAVATGGLVVNLVGLAVLHGGRAANLNVRAVWWHVLGDTLGSAQAVLAGGLILAFGWTWADPVASMLIAGLVIYASWLLIREAVGVLMESAPAHIDVDAVRARLLRVPGAVEVHDLHVWTIASGLVALSAHVVAVRPPAEVVTDLRRDLAEQFGVSHTTIEFDPPGASDRSHLPL